MARILDQYGRPYEGLLDKMFAQAFAHFSKVLQPKNLDFFGSTLLDQFGRPIYTGPKTMKFKRYNKLTSE